MLRHGDVHFDGAGVGKLGGARDLCGGEIEVGDEDVQAPARVSSRLVAAPIPLAPAGDKERFYRPG